ncbi:DegT/DnrJ/EryC1/StrS family aminotransferase [bacterium]|nr:DegT/DnrJ/EryC1/StrS family aminotransferase [bacterium]
MSSTTNIDKLAIEGGNPVRNTEKNPWPEWPNNQEADWERELEPALRDVYLSRSEGLPATQGEAFGASFAAYCDGRYGIIMPHGTDAISAAIAGALDLDGIGEGGEVIIPNYTFIATASAALSVRCSLSLVDIDPVSFTILPEAIEAAITERTVGILPVHLGGHPADMDSINEIAKRHDLVVVEDCAQAHGAEVNGKKVGSLGDVGAFSFQSSKNLTSGEGGCIVTNDIDIRDRAYAFKDVGRRPGGERWEYPRLGWNYRTSEYLAAILLMRLPTLEDQTKQRNDNAAYLSNALETIDGITPPGWRPWVTQHGYHLYMSLYDPEAFGGRTRDEFLAALRAEGISCTPGYQRPLTDEGALKTILDRYPDKVRRNDCPNIEHVCAHSFWFYQSMLLGSREDIDDIIQAIHKVQAAFRS